MDNPTLQKAKELKKLGKSLKEANKLHEASLNFKKAIELISSTMGENNADSAVLHSELGSVYNRQGKYNDALLCYDKAMGIYLK